MSREWRSTPQRSATKSATSCCRWMIPSASRLGISRRWTAMRPTGPTMGRRFVPTVQFSTRIPAARSLRCCGCSAIQPRCWMPPTAWTISTTASVSWTKPVRPSMRATAAWMLWTKPCACWPRMAARPPRLSRGCSIKAGWKSAAGAFITIWTKRTSQKNCSRF